jgi:hypothetical protein
MTVRDLPSFRLIPLGGYSELTQRLNSRRLSKGCQIFRCWFSISEISRCPIVNVTLTPDVPETSVLTLVPSSPAMISNVHRPVRDQDYPPEISDRCESYTLIWSPALPRLMGLASMRSMSSSLPIDSLRVEVISSTK